MILLRVGGRPLVQRKKFLFEKFFVKSRAEQTNVIKHITDEGLWQVRSQKFAVGRAVLEAGNNIKRS